LGRQDEQYRARGRLVGLRALAAVAGFASGARAILAKRAIGKALAGRALIGLSRAAIGDQDHLARGPHLLLAATLRQARQPVTGKRQQNGQYNLEAKGGHRRMVNGRTEYLNTQGTRPDSKV
jgi:hypothetical protein